MLAPRTIDIDTAKNELCRVALDPASGLPRGTPEVLLRHRGVGGLDGAVVVPTA